jgi:hypothetical protein
MASLQCHSECCPGYALLQLACMAMHGAAMAAMLHHAMPSKHTCKCDASQGLLLVVLFFAAHL